MWLELFFRGIIVGFLASISVGPVAILCIQRTISKNQRAGFFSGLGAATADTIFATVAFFSLALVMTFIEKNIVLFKVLSGLAIIGVGVSIFFKNPAVQIRHNRAGRSSLWQDYISVFFITLANPAFILVFVVLFAAFGLSLDNTGELNAAAMLVGVFAGASTWWFLITFVINLFRKRFRPRHILWMNRIAGGVIMVLGLGTILSTIVNIHFNVL